MYILYALYSLKHKRQTKHPNATMARRSVLGAQPAGCGPSGQAVSTALPRAITVIEARSTSRSKPLLTGSSLAHTHHLRQQRWISPPPSCSRSIATSVWRAARTAAAGRERRARYRQASVAACVCSGARVGHGTQRIGAVER
mmetsp:Transcript_92534/g.277665  ORF Transcript_92534/g.277665 Transcript_92534/m.277665 type:complete len:142 (+) Transcript_92534:29-454(+)